MFKPVSSQVKFPKLEEDVLQFWKQNDTFKKSMQLREKNERYVFFEGPPTANGRPGLHHVLARVFKDLMPRYHTMKGKYVLRKGGWDTHGLPVELEVEKKIGSRGKQDIEKFGIAEFNRLCRQSVWEYVQEWERMTDRIGFWVDTEHAYITYDNSYIESGWWILKSLWERGLLFKDYKVAMHCPRCSTTLSDAEVALGYQDNVEDPSVWVKFKVKEGPFVGAYLLAWTTTPWTLPANVALALKGDADYVLAKLGDEKYLLAQALMRDVLGAEAEVLQVVKGADLVGTRYENLFEGVPAKGETPDMTNAYTVVADESVSLEDGTGIVHIAPAYGDLDVGRRHHLPTLFSVDLSGHLMPEFGEELGANKWFKEADKDIARNLRKRGLLLKESRVHHSYPFCWRCESPLLYYAKSSWYIRTTALKERLLSANDEINWYPPHIQHGRFGNWLENNVDWALSRERYWGTPLPIWQCEGCGAYACVGSVKEMRERALNAEQVNRDEMDLHRPWIDAVKLQCDECGGQMNRLPDVLDCWFDSGAMPYAQWHYPFENQVMFEDQFPADFICEAIDQTRGWFYSLHALGVLMKNSPVYKNVMVLGHIQDAAGKKMSKSLGNVIDPWHVLNTYGADPLRWYLYRTTSLGNPYRFNEHTLAREVVSGVFNTLWNTYSFFVTYANIDNWLPPTEDGGRRTEASVGLPSSVSRQQPLDRWILSELHVLVKAVDDNLAQYDITDAVRRVEAFVEVLSNWYVRRSRRRFWKTQTDADKQSAYATLYECLVTLTRLMAPFTPFVAEELYQNLVRSVDASAPESVHHCDFPVADMSKVDERLMANTRLVMRLASLGLAARKQSNLKVRQPLAEAVVVVPDDDERAAMLSLSNQLAEEWNVKAIRFASSQHDVADLKLNPLPAKLGPKFGAKFPQVRQALFAQENEYALKLQAGEPVRVQLNGETHEVLPEEVEVQLTPKQGWALANDANYVVALSTMLTESLKREGVARELVRQYNDLRKAAGFRVEDLMRATWSGNSELQQVFAEFGDYIKQETLAVELVRTERAPEGATSATLLLDEGMVTLSVRPTGTTVHQAQAQPAPQRAMRSARKASARKTASKPKRRIGSRNSTRTAKTASRKPSARRTTKRPATKKRTAARRMR